MMLYWFIVALVCVQGGWCGRIYPRMIFGNQYPDHQNGGSGFGSGVFHQGSPMNSPFHFVGPGGDPTKQQANSLQSMTPGGSCVPTQEECECPNQAFKTPMGCYFCNCLGHESQGQVPPPTPIIISAGTSTASINNQTPPTSNAAAPVTGALGAAQTATTPSSSQCATAAQLCLLNCPGGYLVDPDDCTFCVCKTAGTAGR